MGWLTPVREESVHDSSGLLPPPCDTPGAARTGARWALSRPGDLCLGGWWLSGYRPRGSGRQAVGEVAAGDTSGARGLADDAVLGPSGHCGIVAARRCPVKADRVATGYTRRLIVRMMPPHSAEGGAHVLRRMRYGEPRRSAFLHGLRSGARRGRVAPELVAGLRVARLGDRLFAVILDTALLGALFAVVGMWAAARWGGVTPSGFAMTGDAGRPHVRRRRGLRLPLLLAARGALRRHDRQGHRGGEGLRTSAGTRAARSARSSATCCDSWTASPSTSSASWSPSSPGSASASGITSPGPT